jgi:hypothetical protein
MTRHYAMLTSLALLSASSILHGAAPSSEIVDKLSKLPLAFEENRGQAPPRVDFMARGGGYSVFLSRGNASISLRRGKSADPVTIELRLVGASQEAAALARQPLPGKVNYFLGNDPKRWRTDIPTFQRVQYPRVYPGIDLAYYGDEGRVEYDFLVAPNADPDAIRLAVDGTRSVSVDGNGDLVLETGSGAVRFRRPLAYQEIAGARHEVESRYVLTGAHAVGFAVGPHDARQALVIDPSLVYSTYLGGSTYDWAQAIALDAGGNAYVTGFTESMDFPLVNPEQPFFPGSSAIFVSKLAADGASLVYSTYLAGSLYDFSYSIAVDGSGSAYVTGYTESTDFPVMNPIYGTLNGATDAFLTKFSAAGDALEYSTYLGGSSNDYGYGVAVDSNNAAYLTGQTVSSDFPVTSGAYQTSSDGSCGFVTKVNPKGSALAWSTYFGRNCSANPKAVAVSSSFSVYLTGYAYSGFPVTTGVAQPIFGGVEDAFVTMLDKTGKTLVYSTYLGGSQEDYGAAIAVDASGNAYVTGSTTSPNLPVTASAPQPKLAGGFDGFVAKLNASGTAWSYLTYLGGGRDDYAYGIAVDSSGNATVVGSTISVDFPMTAALQPSLAGNSTLVFKTTSTGSSWNESDAGLGDQPYSMAIDPASGAHLLAATAAGLYQSLDGGAHWTGVSSFLGSFMAAVAFSTAGGPVYAASEASVYSSADNGVTWTFAGIAPCGVGTIVADPATPSTLYISNGNSSLFFYPACVAQSTNGGATWTNLTGLTFNYAVYGLAINPLFPAVLYAATDSGLYKSGNSGETWTQLTFTGYTNPYVTGVMVSPVQPAVVYANVYDSIWKSTNSGSTWTSLNDYGVASMAIAPSKPSVLYAGTYGNGMWVSSNAGSSWLPAGLTGDTILATAVDPTNSATVYAGLEVYPDAFVAKLNTAGSKLAYSTYLGGTGSDFAYGVAINGSGNAIVAGQTLSTDFPSTAGAFQPADGVGREAGFVAEVSGKTPACTYTASPASYLFYSFGGTLDLSVVAPSGCAWTATPNVSWITVTRGQGPGVGPLAIGVASNTGAARTGSIAIGTGSVAITQVASDCTYTLSTYDPTFPQTGGPLSIQVTAGAGCQWNVSSLPLWLTVTSGASGTGNGTVKLKAAANPFPVTRYGYPTIAGNFVEASETGTTPEAGRTPAGTPNRLAPRCVPLGAACPAGAAQRPQPPGLVLKLAR